MLAGLCGGLYALDDLLTNEAKAENRSDGRPRVPPGQRVHYKGFKGFCLCW